ncbi:hypothetical protein IC614_02960 [Allosphingosinicella flava]|uniref:Uncharacterized protein n=1 Tax=Allosphingosinicella flava TaxID=2771430 RepID=A0A7T2GL79_9SPHN|nr:hypothetical protein [Sphingosinicella flava]QPQ55578.1 hypothetical protein IC614_02960 [Sphingosinicella flava]
MTSPTIHGKRAVFSASAVLDAIASDLALIKTQDKLTFADIGAVLGRSEDQAAKYCDGSAAMDAVTFARGKREWGKRFTGSYDRLCEETGRANQLSDRSATNKILAAAFSLSLALEDDGEIDLEEVRQNRGALENARAAIDAQLAKLVRAA